jgi:hypothetical protein
MATTANFPTGEVFDVYAFSNSGSAALCAVYWGGTTRSSSAGGKSGSQDVTIVQKNGLYVNNAALASGNCYNNSTSYTPSANQATYLGSFHTSAAGKTEWVCHPAAASGGSSLDEAVYNAYNQHPYYCENADSENTFAYTTHTWRIYGNSSGNQMYWLDGLGFSQISASVSALVNNTSTSCGYIALGYNSTTTPQATLVSGCVSAYAPIVQQNNLQGTIGYNYLAFLQIGNASGTVTWAGTNYAASTIQIGGM